MEFKTVPTDSCPECPLTQDNFDYHREVMVYAVHYRDDGGVVVRYICQSCDLIWDCSWSREMVDTFSAPYLEYREGKRVQRVDSW
jgi:hypothetical protein